jgi:hypothetical protein
MPFVKQLATGLRVRKERLLAAPIPYYLSLTNTEEIIAYQSIANIFMIIKGSNKINNIESPIED